MNDVIFGWLSDHCCTRKTRRTDSIRWGGLVWALAFVLIWVPVFDANALPDSLDTVSGASGIAGPWGVTRREILQGLHFMLVLCVYDGGLTFVEVNHSALLAEMTTSPSERAECNMWSAICAGIGALSSWLAYVTWDPLNLTPFRTMTIGVSATAWLVFAVSSKYLEGFVVHRAAVNDSVVVSDDSVPTVTEGQLVSPSGTSSHDGPQRRPTVSSAATVSTGGDNSGALLSPGPRIAKSPEPAVQSPPAVTTAAADSNTGSWWAFFTQVRGHDV